MVTRIRANVKIICTGKFGVSAIENGGDMHKNVFSTEAIMKGINKLSDVKTAKNGEKTLNS